MRQIRPNLDIREQATGVVQLAEPILADGHISDLLLTVGGKQRHLWGRGGRAREEQWAAQLPDGVLPVLIGPTLGRCLELLAQSGRPVAVADQEGAVQQATHLRERFGQWRNVLWLDGATPEENLERLERWQSMQGLPTAMPLMAPASRRLSPELYGALHDALDARARFWKQVRFPKFQTQKPRILLLDSPYFLQREIKEALASLGFAYEALAVPGGQRGESGFVEELLRRVLEFRPDFVLSVNHLGLDCEGRLTELLERLGLPLASWFVDNPHLILSHYPGMASSGTAVFTWDADNIESLRAKGFEHVHYLPLATALRIFRQGLPSRPQWRGTVSFVGDSMAAVVGDCLSRCAAFPWLTGEYQALAAGFTASRARSVEDYFAQARPELAARLRSLGPAERLSCDMLITFEATRQYRKACVTSLAPFAPVIGGDTEGWSRAFAPGAARLVGRLDYYDDLPGFYPACPVTLNCTSRQMKGAVNQRVFDVPACGGFVLTDGQEQLAELFEPGREVTVFRSPEEIAELLPRLLQDSGLRQRVSEAARRRIVAEHTYEHRLLRLCAIMRETFEARSTARA